LKLIKEVVLPNFSGVCLDTTLLYYNYYTVTYLNRYRLGGMEKHASSGHRKQHVLFKTKNLDNSGLLNNVSILLMALEYREANEENYSALLPP
jgi:hypothetical protein